MIAAASALLFVGVGVVPFSAPAEAGPAVANNTFYWNGTTANACALCEVTVLVEAWSNIYTPPTNNSGVVWQNGSNICFECIQFLSPGPANAFGLWFAEMSWYNMLNQNDGQVGFLMGFTNQS
jgi:hypothetical protein